MYIIFSVYINSLYIGFLGIIIDTYRSTFGPCVHTYRYEEKKKNLGERQLLFFVNETWLDSPVPPGKLERFTKHSGTPKGENWKKVYTKILWNLNRIVYSTNQGILNKIKDKLTSQNLYDVSWDIKKMPQSFIHQSQNKKKYSPLYKTHLCVDCLLCVPTSEATCWIFMGRPESMK